MEPPQRTHEESSGVFFCASEPHLLTIAKKIAKAKNIEFEEVDEKRLYLKGTDEDFCKQVQDELDKQVHNKNKKPYSR